MGKRMKPEPATPVPGHWDSDLYEQKHSFVWKYGESLLELLAPRPGERILDLGCGTGHLTAKIADAGAAVLGIDSSPAMIEQARQHYPNLHFELADARELALAGPFDAIFSNAALHWIREADRVVAGIRRVLRPGGRFVAEFGGKGNVRIIVAALEEVSRILGQAVVSPWYFPSVAEYASLLEREGMEGTYALLFDRPTPLEREAGMRDWIAMFGSSFLEPIPVSQRDEFVRRVEDRIRAELYREGQWFADYRRLRVVAQRIDP
jgi:trans-aconitate 2-methyltransferase